MIELQDIFNDGEISQPRGTVLPNTLNAGTFFVLDTAHGPLLYVGSEVNTPVCVGDKLPLIANHLFVGDANHRAFALPISGDLSMNSGAFTIASNAVTTSKIADNAVTAVKVPNFSLPAAKLWAGTNNIVLGRQTGSVEELTMSTLRSMLNVANGANNYVHPNHTGDVTSTGDGATMIAEGAVTDSKLRHGQATSVIGRPGTTAGVVQDITAATNTVLRRGSTGSLAFGTLSTAHYSDGSVSLAKMAPIGSGTVIGRVLSGSGPAAALTASDLRTLLNVENGAQVNAVVSVAGRTGAVVLSATDVGLANVTNDAQVRKTASATVIGNVPTWGSITGDLLATGYGVEAVLAGDAYSLPTAEAVKDYVDSLLGSNDAMVFKGTLGTGGTYTSLPTTHSAGWTVRVITAGTYSGTVCEVGDLLIATIDRAGSGNLSSDWTVVQTNIDGAVTGPASATDNHVVLFNGSTGKLVKSSGTALGNGTLTLATSGIATGSGSFSANQAGNSSFTVTVPGTNLAMGGSGDARTVTSSTGSSVSLPLADGVTAGLMSVADKGKLNGIAVNANNYVHPNHTGDVTSAADGATTIAANAVTADKFRQSTSMSVVGHPTSGGNVQDIQAGSDHQVLRRNGTTLAFGAVALNQSNAVTGTLAVANGGTGAITFASGEVLVGNVTGAVTTLSRNGIDTRASFPPSTHSHSAADITSGTLNSSRLSGSYTITVVGNASTATALATARAINGVSFDGTAPITITANTPNSLTFNNAGSGAASGSTFNGGSAITVSYNTVGAPSTSGANATGTWGISITGNAATVTGGVYTSGDQTIAGTKTFSTGLTLGSASQAANLAPLKFLAATSAITNLQANSAHTTGEITLTLPAMNGQIALQSELPSVGNGTLTLNVSGVGLAGSASFLANQSGASTFTVTSNATSVNTANTIVSRDANGNFVAGTITAALSGNASSASQLQTARTINGVSFNGSANITVTANTPNSLTFNSGGSGAATGATFNGGSAVTISYNTIGAPSVSGTGATGTWDISISGNAATASSTINLKANNSSGVLQVTGPGTGTTRVMTVPDSNFTAARTDATQTFTGVQTFTSTIGGSINGNAATVTDGVYLSGSQTLTGAKVLEDVTLGASLKTIKYGSVLSITLPAQGTRAAFLNVGVDSVVVVRLSSSENGFYQPIVLQIARNSTGSTITIHKDNPFFHEHSNDVAFSADTATGNIYAEKVAYSTGRSFRIHAVQTLMGTVTVLNGSLTATSVADQALSRLGKAIYVSGTAVTVNGVLTSGVSTGTAPFVVSSTTRVSNLNVATAGTADQLTTARTINGVSFNGTANITVTANTASSLTFNNSGSGAASGTSFNGGSAVTVSYNTVGAPSTTGANASGSWAIDVTGSSGNTMNWKMNATTGLLQVTGVAAGQGRLMTVPDANFTVARTDAAQTFTGTQTFSSTIEGSISGNAATATTANAWASSRSIGMIGDVTWSVSVNGSANVSATGTIANNVVTNAKLRQSPSLSVMGNPTTGSQNVSDISGSLSGQVLRISGSTLGFGALDLASANAVTGVLAAANVDSAIARLASPTFTGTPAAPTASLNTNTTQIATTAYVIAAIADDAPTKTGTGASGTWGISITGNAATATLATNWKMNAAAGYLQVTGTGSNNRVMTVPDANFTVARTDAAQTFAGTQTFSSTITGSISGNAATATTLQTARSINGTSFNGSADITTANWGTARTLTIGSTGKSVNGSANVAWTLAEIGAAATSHKYHSFSSGQYFYDNYEQGNNFRLFTENATFSTSRFRTIAEVEYWNFVSSSWVAWSGGDANIKTILSGRETGGFGVTHDRRRFRFKLNVSSGWPTLMLYFVQSNWSPITYPGMTLTLESSTTQGGTYTLRDTAEFTSANTGNNWGIHARTTSSLHTGDSWVRVTFDITDWVDSGGSTTFPIKRFEMLSNYAGSDMLPFSWDYDRNMTFNNNVSATRFTSTVATGTAPLTVTSTTRVANLNVATAGTADTLTTARTLWGQSFNGSGNITGAMSSVTTIAMSGQLTNTVSTGTAPFVVSSTTRVANLNVATAGTADTLTTSRNIGGTGFNGSANIEIIQMKMNSGSGLLQVTGAGTGTTRVMTIPDANFSVVPRTAGDAGSGFIDYNSTTKAAGKLYGGTTSPDSTTRLNYDGHFHASAGVFGGLHLKTVRLQSSVSQTYTVTTQNCMIICEDDATGGFDITLPAAPVDGQILFFKDISNLFGTTTTTMLRNGKLINGSAANYVTAGDGTTHMFVYVESKGSWYTNVLQSY